MTWNAWLWLKACMASHQPSPVHASRAMTVTNRHCLTYRLMGNYFEIGGTLPPPTGVPGTMPAVPRGGPLQAIF
jgi:hypothetical protein